MTTKASRPPRPDARSILGRADLVRLWLAWKGSSPANHIADFEAAAAVLGFRREPDGVRTPGPAQPPKTRRKPLVPGSPPPELPPVAMAVSPLPPATFFKLDLREPISETAREQAVQVPVWLKGAKALDADGPGESSARAPRKKPLALGSRLWPMLRAVLGEIVDGPDPDVAKIVDRIGAGRGLRRVPMLPRRRWTGEVRILADFANRTAPFHRDYSWLRDALAQQRGEEGLVVEALESDPGVNPKVRRTDREAAPDDWRPPAAAVPLLLLTDLGLYDPSGPAYEGWVAFGRRLRALGRKAAVLCPVPADKIPARLRGLFRIYSWDRNSPLKVLGGGGAGTHRPVVFDGSVRTAALDVLSLLAPVLVAEPADVRSVRQWLPPGGGTVAVEALLWRNETAAMQSAIGEAESDAPGEADQALDRVVAADQGLYTNDPATLRALRRRWTEHPALLRERAVKLILMHHAYWPESMRFAEYDEIDRLMRDVGQSMSETGSDWLPEGQRDKFEKWKRDIVVTLRTRAHAPGLRHWNVKDIRRQSIEDPAAWTMNPHRVARWALAQAPGPEPLQLPRGVDADAVRPFLPPGSNSTTRVHLRQQGSHLLLSRSPASSAQGSGALPMPPAVSELAVADALGGQLALRVVERGTETAEGWIVPLTDVAAELPVRLIRDVRSVILETGVERVVLAGISREDLLWATHLRRDVTGLHAFGPEWCARTIDLLWHPPPGPGSGFWADGHGDTTFGVDGFGLYADLHLGKATQRCRWILPGTFLMGSPEDEIGRRGDETRHLVTLTHGFWLADTSVTVELWNEVMDDDRREENADPRNPVTEVSWNDAQRFLERLEARVPGLRAGLPTEAQWEYACRAGTLSAYAFGDEVGPSDANIEPRLRSVASYRPNAWGLFDMHGSVWEWCHDWYASYGSGDRVDPEGPDKGSLRVLRGRSWIDNAVLARSARRDAIDPGGRSGSFGFRLAPGRMSGSPAERGRSKSGEPRGARGSEPADGGGRPHANPARKPAARKPGAKKPATRKAKRK